MIFTRRKLNNIFKNHLVCFDTIPFITYLYNVQCSKKENNNTTKNAKVYCTFLLLKLAYYVIVCEIVFRTFYFTTLENQPMVLKNHLFFNPLFVWAFSRFRLLTYTVLRVGSFSGLLVISVDYLFYFQMTKSGLAKETYEMFVANCQNFMILNSEQFSNSFLTKCQQFAQIFNGNRTDKSFQFSIGSLNSFPNLSKKLRAQMVAFVFLSETAIVCFNAALCKINLFP